VTRYELLDRIGVGGMAEIFRGRALAAGGFEKPVAIKRILPHLSQDQRFVELLIAEAKVLSMLRHRNIVQIFDVGLGDDGQYFLVMEFVHGLDLGRVQVALEAKRRLIPVDLSLHIGAEICEALEHAHSVRDPDGKQMRLVHRDISPSNVLLSRAGEVKLTDFGIAKRAEEVTTHGGVRGKFAYISPEQAKNEPVDSRSDVFSLGIVLFELLTGRRLFSALPDLEALRGVREGKIPRPRDLDGNLPQAVDELIGKALSRDPDKRFSSAGEFGAALRSLRYSLEVSSGDPSAELARVVSTAEAPATIPPNNQQFETGEATVIRIHSAEAFAMNDARTAISQARQVIDRFEEEETRMSKLGGETLRNLRRAAEEHSGELAVPPVQPPRRPARETRDVRSGDRRSEPRVEGRVDPRVDPRVDSRLDPRHGSITGDEPTSLADPLEQRLMMGQVSDKFELEEETIARPSPLRPPAPSTLKRPPPATGPGGSGGDPSSLPGVRAMPRSSSPPLSSPATSPSAPTHMPSMPDAAGWEAPSFVASPYATPPPERAAVATLPGSGMSSSARPMMGAPMGPPMGGPMNPMNPMAGPTPSPVGPMNPMGNPMAGPTPNPMNGMGPVPNPAMMPGAYGYAGYPADASVAPAYSPRQPGGFEPRTGARPDGGTALERWRTAALVLGAVAMAVLAFAVTRSCLHQEKRPASSAPSSAPAPTSPAPETPAPK
jgi:eukaryotic-like serine/threonine-protein kinase